MVRFDRGRIATFFNSAKRSIEDSYRVVKKTGAVIVLERTAVVTVVTVNVGGSHVG